MSQNQSGASRPVPVILAASPTPCLWPYSTRENPYVFRPGAGGVSAVEKLLDALAARQDFAVPLVFVPDTLSGDAVGRLSGYGNALKFVQVPPNEETGAAAILAALLSAQEGCDAPLTFIRANLHCPDIGALLDEAIVAARQSEKAELPVSFVRPVRIVTDCGGNGEYFEINGRDNRLNLQTARPVDQASEAGTFPALIEMFALVKSAGIEIAKSGIILNGARQLAPEALEACGHALQAAEFDGRWIRLRQQNLAPSCVPALCRLLAEPGGSLIAHQAAETVGLTHCLADSPFNGGRLPALSLHEDKPVAVVGNSGHVLHVTGDGILVVQRGFEVQVRQPAAEFTAPRGLCENPVVDHWWGSSETLCDISGLHVILHSVAPESARPEMAHGGRTATLSVVSGRGFLTADGKRTSLAAGRHVTIPARTFYGLTSSGAETLVVNETLTGLNRDVHTAAALGL